MTRKNAVLICGPSGAGKGTIIKKLIERCPENVALQVSHTSRAPRAGEVEGVHYYFSNVEEMRAMHERGEFLELSEVHGRLYGPSIASLNRIRESGRTPIMDVDIQGCIKLSKHPELADAVFIWIDAPSDHDLVIRLLMRGSETAEQIEQRMEAGRIDRLKAKDSGLFAYWIVNSKLDDAVEEVATIIKLL